MDRLWLIRAIRQHPKPFGTLADNAAPNLATLWGCDNTGNWYASRHDGEIDCEFVTTGEKLTCAVEWVDDQETLTRLGHSFVTGGFL